MVENGVSNFSIVGFKNCEYHSRTNTETFSIFVMLYYKHNRIQAVKLFIALERSIAYSLSVSI